jgi:hypothetical protein
MRARRTGPGTRSDTVMPSHDWISNVVGKISPVRLSSIVYLFIAKDEEFNLKRALQYIDLDNSNEEVRRQSEDTFKEA